MNNTLDELVKLWAFDFNNTPEVPEKTVRDILNFALMETDRQTNVVLPSADGSHRRIRLTARDVGQGVVLVRLLGKEVHPIVRRQTAKCLADLSARNENQVKIACYAGVLDTLVNSLGKAGGPALQEQIVKCLANLALPRRNHVQMAASTALLEALVRLLEKSGNPNVQVNTVLCLTNLAASEEHLERIGSYPGVLNGMATLLDQSQVAELRQQILKCLTKLAMLPSNQLRIVSDYPNVLDGLVRFLGEAWTPDVQLDTLKCLNTLGDHYQSNKIDIVSHPGVITALVRLLKYNWITSKRIRVQKEAAICLMTLASARPNSVRIASQDTLDALINCLGKVTVWDVVGLAAECLKQLAAVPENQVKIVYHPRAIAALMRILVQKDHPSKEVAASCLSRLAIAQETKVFIASHPGMLDALVRLLGMNGSSRTLENTIIKCMAMLASANENQARIAGHPDVLAALVRVMNTSRDESILEQSAICLSHLAKEKGEEIACNKSALQALVNLLVEYRTTGVLEHTAKCLTNLAFSNQNQVRIASFPGMLNALVDLLRSDVSPGVQDQIVRCLAKLSTAAENKLKIRSYPGVLDALKRLIANDVSSVQRQAEWCLRNLSEGSSVEDFNVITRGKHPRSGESLSDPDLWWNDPLTWDIMCDPVKCTDGRTYDRWTIIDHKIVSSPYDRRKAFKILCEDVDVRKSLFRDFPEREVQFRNRRKKYREEALQKARMHEFADAIEQLTNVLEWDPADTPCREELWSMRQLKSSSTQKPEKLLDPEDPPTPRESFNGQSQELATIEDQSSTTMSHIDEQAVITPVMTHEDVMGKEEPGMIAWLIVVLFVGLWFVLI